MTPRKINQISGALLLIGLVAAIAVFFAMPADPDDDPLLAAMKDRRYEREMRMIGGTANLASAEIVDGFLDLWHGRKLAGTLVVVTIGATLLFRFVASHPDPAASSSSSEAKGPPSDPL